MNTRLIFIEFHIMFIWPNIAIQIEICVAVILIRGAFCDVTQGKSNTAIKGT